MSCSRKCCNLRESASSLPDFNFSFNTVRRLLNRDALPSAVASARATRSSFVTASRPVARSSRDYELPRLVVCAHDEVEKLGNNLFIFPDWSGQRRCSGTVSDAPGEILQVTSQGIQRLSVDSRSKSICFSYFRDQLSAELDKLNYVAYQADCTEWVKLGQRVKNLDFHLCGIPKVPKPSAGGAEGDAGTASSPAPLPELRNGGLPLNTLV